MAKERHKQGNEEALPKLNYDWNLLGNARIAGEYLEQGEQGVPFAKKGLELILGDAKIVDPWVVQTVTDPEVIHKTITNQLRAYNQYKGRQAVGDMVVRYSGDISKYLGN